jgi:hypothetical protein
MRVTTVVHYVLPFLTLDKQTSAAARRLMLIFQTGSSGEVAYRQCKPYFSSCPELDFRRDASRTLVGRGRGYGTRTTSAESSLKSRTSHWHIR